MLGSGESLSGLSLRRGTRSNDFQCVRRSERTARLPDALNSQELMHPDWGDGGGERQAGARADESSGKNMERRLIRGEEKSVRQ